VTRLAIVAALLALATPAGAADGAAAESLFRAGKRAAADGRLEQACEHFAASHAAEPTVGALLNLARCQAEIGRVASAWRSFRTAASMATAVSQHERAASARRHAEALEPRLAHLLVEAAATPGLAITIDGEVFAAGEVALDPGVHHLEATAPGRRAWRKEVTVADESRQTVTVPQLPLLEGDVAVPPAVVAGYVVAGVGAVGVGLGVALGLTALGDRNELERSNSCPARRCTSEGFARLDTIEATATASTVSFAVGGAAFATGLLLATLWPAPGEASPPASAASSLRAPVVTVGLGGLGVSGRF
jgi:hypothetical protein